MRDKALPAGRDGDGIVERSVTLEVTTRLGRRALRSVETLHRTHPFDELEQPERGSWYDS